jgi:hypothetical protein
VTQYFWPWIAMILPLLVIMLATVLAAKINEKGGPARRG